MDGERVVVIGGGAAGLGAASTLVAAGVPTLLIEARHRLGGRAATSLAGGLPLDLGCGWLHSADRNPLVERARAHGFTIDTTPAPWGGPSLTTGFPSAEQETFAAASRAFWRRLDEAAAGPDGPAATCLEPGGRWNCLLDAVSTYINGAELDRVSIHDFAAYEDTGTNWRVVEGYGAAIAAEGAGIPVELGCPVTLVDHRGPTIRLETARGTVPASAVIVTLPTSLIAAEAMRFLPALPDKVEAAAGLPLGLADKVYLALEDAEAFPAESRAFGRTDRAETGAYHVRPLGRPVIEGYFGGRCAAALEAEGAAGFAAFAVDELAGLFGNAFRRRVRPLAVTRWQADPWARGSYSHALPGRAEARARLAAPVDERLFFAGEACSPDFFSTAHGAYLTGVSAARAAMKALGRASS